MFFDLTLTRAFVVGKAGLEPATSASRTLRATKLRHFPWFRTPVQTWGSTEAKSRTSGPALVRAGPGGVPL
jgi:hypothetical protein